MYDTLHYCRSFRTLNVINEINAELLVMEVDCACQQHTWTGHGAVGGCGGIAPKDIPLDNGSDLRTAVFMDYCEEKGIEFKFIQPSKPKQNAFIERFNRTDRHEVLNAHIIESFERVRKITEESIHSNNQYRPNEANEKLLPIYFR